MYPQSSVSASSFSLEGREQVISFVCLFVSRQTKKHPQISLSFVIMRKPLTAHLKARSDQEWKSVKTVYYSQFLWDVFMFHSIVA